MNYNRRRLQKNALSGGNTENNYVGINVLDNKEHTANHCRVFFLLCKIIRLNEFGL